MDSYPPHLLRLPGSAPGSPARGVTAGSEPETVTVPVAGQQAQAPPALLASPGTPGTYDPPVSPADRPETIAQMQERVQVATPEPWPAGTWVPMGSRGRRGHWDGTQWRSNPSPGYGAETVSVRSEPEQTTGGSEQ